MKNTEVISMFSQLSSVEIPLSKSDELWQQIQRTIANVEGNLPKSHGYVPDRSLRRPQWQQWLAGITTGVAGAGVTLLLILLVVFPHWLTQHRLGDKNRTLTPTTAANFGQATMQQIKDGFQKMNVSKGAYILTGGLGITDPVVGRITSNGELTLETRNPGYEFDLVQDVPNPSKWRVLEHSSNNVNVAEQGTYGTPIPWVQKQTRAGRTYYEWDVYSGFTWFYFQKDSTYLVLRVRSPGLSKYPFPQDIMAHLKPFKRD